jgi:hypothetical protein
MVHVETAAGRPKEEQVTSHLESLTGSLLARGTGGET